MISFWCHCIFIAIYNSSRFTIIVWVPGFQIVNYQLVFQICSIIIYNVLYSGLFSKQIILTKESKCNFQRIKFCTLWWIRKLILCTSNYVRVLAFSGSSVHVWRVIFCWSCVTVSGYHKYKKCFNSDTYFAFHVLTELILISVWISFIYLSIAARLEYTLQSVLVVQVLTLHMNFVIIYIRYPRFVDWIEQIMEYAHRKHHELLHLKWWRIEVHWLRSGTVVACLAISKPQFLAWSKSEKYVSWCVYQYKYFNWVLLL